MKEFARLWRAYKLTGETNMVKRVFNVFGGSTARVYVFVIVILGLAIAAGIYTLSNPEIIPADVVGEITNM